MSAIEAHLSVTKTPRSTSEWLNEGFQAAESRLKLSVGAQKPSSGVELKHSREDQISQTQ